MIYLIAEGLTEELVDHVFVRCPGSYCIIRKAVLENILQFSDVELKVFKEKSTFIYC